MGGGGEAAGSPCVLKVLKAPKSPLQARKAAKAAQQLRRQEGSKAAKGGSRAAEMASGGADGWRDDGGRVVKRLEWSIFFTFTLKITKNAKKWLFKLMPLTYIKSVFASNPQESHFPIAGEG